VRRLTRLHDEPHTLHNGVMRGRPPTPKHILQMRGSKHAKNREELGVQPDVMLAPEWLKERAKGIFDNVVAWMTNMGTLAESDINVVTRYAVTYVQWEFAAQELQKCDATWIEVSDKDGNLRFSRASAMASQARDCGEQLRHLETVLGLTPADRTRLGYKAEKIVVDPMDELIANRTG
jgi:P27 family predicted phage terminase small subunit